MICMNFSVGFVNVLIKICVLVLVAIASECTSQSFKLLASFRLRKKGRAPVMYHSDTSIQTFPATLRRFGSIRYLGFFALAIFSFALLPAEIASDFGVMLSERCKTRYQRTDGICAQKPPIQHIVSWSKRIPTAFLVEDVEWNNIHLARYPIRQGLRKQFDGREYFGPSQKRNISLPVVIANCSVGPISLLEPASFFLELGIDNSTHSEGVRLLRLRARDGSMSFSGFGGLLDNYDSFFTFLVSLPSRQQVNAIPSEVSFVSVLEYTDPRRLRDIDLGSTESEGAVILSKSVILFYNVSCGIASLNTKQFAEAIYSYRYAQLSRSAHRKQIRHTNVPMGSNLVQVPQPLAAHDVVRAVIAAKFAEEQQCEGESMFYTTCVCYKFMVAFPLFFIAAFLVVLSIFLYTRSLICKDLVKAPVTSDAWSMFALSMCATKKKFIEVGTPEYETYTGKHRFRKCIGEYILTGTEDERLFDIEKVFFVDGSIEDQSVIRRFISNRTSSAVSLL